uniref:RNA polymerase I termination factor-like n=1 Tax=Erigeron canadensis TaxID=72917 RepID=UPI001CB9CE44|nr:RNA polymerase I termination factor-like [Erigeron canadensis]XP_043612541.1 RNA polymerase I termination factor-like [Erigeron canadensis]XP_043612545.1 RNA polymerase I termination factor-like [Erigeron canadensis]
MGKTSKDSDAMPAKMEKSSIKNKTKTNDLQHVGDKLEINGDFLTEKGNKFRGKKKKSETIEGRDEDQYDKGNLLNDGGLSKKDKKRRKRDFPEKAQIKENEQGQDDGPAVERDGDQQVVKIKISDGNGPGMSPDNCQGDMYGKRGKKKKKRTDTRNRDTEMIGIMTEESTFKTQGTEDHHDKSNSVNEDAGEDQYDKDNLVNDGDLQKDNEDAGEDQYDRDSLVNYGDLLKKDKKKRKRDSSEQAQVKDNRQGQVDEATVEKDCDPKPQEKAISDGDGAKISKEHCQEIILEKADKKKQKKKKKKMTDCQSSGTEMNEIVAEESTLKTGSEVSKGIKNNSVEHNSEKQIVKGKGNKVNKETTTPIKNNKEEPNAKGKSKKVSFSGHVEVFPSSDTRTETETETDGLLRAARFTPEEDKIIKEAVHNFIAANNLGDNGIEMVLDSNKHGLKKCWQDIATCIPYRPYRAVYCRGRNLLASSKTRGWTPEEIEQLMELHKKYGKDWKKIGLELGRHRIHVKDAWRRHKFENKKTGAWSQEEYQNLFDLVNLDLQMKINGEKKSKHGMLRDNIPWSAISDKLLTRSNPICCRKWYDQLQSSLVVEEKWSETDDYKMIGALYELDAACVEDVDWDNLLEHRPGDICRKRWEQMVKHIGHKGSKPFAEQVDTLAQRYCPDLADIREAWDKKPLVP